MSHICPVPQTFTENTPAEQEPRELQEEGTLTQALPQLILQTRGGA